MADKLLVVQVAAMGPDFAPPDFHTASNVFPAVTCTAQATFRTASPPSSHGMIANGVFLRDLKKAMFWEQAASQVQGERIWEGFRRSGKRVGMMFWQQSLGENVDLVMSPTPIHKHSGGMIQDCYSKPANLYPRLTKKLGRPFNLMNYWGPLASWKSSEWIAEATCAVMSKPEFAPDLLFTYLPHLDYALQSAGPASRKAQQAKIALHGLLDQLRASAVANGYEWVFYGDYAIETVGMRVAFPNRALRRAGLFRSREVRGMQYADLFSSRAFAMVDHQVAHIYAQDAEAAAEAGAAMRALAGVELVLDKREQEEWGVAHARSGDLVLVAEPGAWFAYPWWGGSEKAPDFASHVDIHNKPGFDPCELFFGWPPPSVSSDTSRVKGSHGRTGPGTAIAWNASIAFPREPSSLLELSAAVKEWLDRQS